MMVVSCGASFIGIHSDYMANNTLIAVFPGLIESIDNKDYVNAQKWVVIIDNCIKTATRTIS